MDEEISVNSQKEVMYTLYILGQSVSSVLLVRPK